MTDLIRALGSQVLVIHLLVWLGQAVCSVLPVFCSYLNSKILILLR